MSDQTFDAGSRGSQDRAAPGASSPAPGSVGSDGAGAVVPLRDVVDPASVRRAPKLGAFLGVGVVVGLVLGVVAAVGWRMSLGDASLKPGVTVTVIVVSVAALGVLVAGGLAVLAERRSLRRSR